MAELVIDGLEAIEVDEDKRQRLAETGVTLGLFLDLQGEVTAVIDAGQSVLEGQLFEACVADPDRRLRGEGLDQVLELGSNGTTSPRSSRALTKLQHTDDATPRLLERHRQDGAGPIQKGGFELAVERVGFRCDRRVGSREIDEAAGQRDVSRQAGLPERQRLGGEARTHLAFVESLESTVMLSDREAQDGAVPDKQHPDLGVGLAPSLSHDQFEEPGKLAFAGQRDADADELLETL